ncbi:hypothetical protein BKA66DRAFT_22866 [Pyrenochaeta sp. MPI-SDFR-AT-0127]|nr:hypothetical protein BKA66DRAFT_22866 [Pyrenochaeta sp. MPI-SDFR-AT-0127]
MQRLLPRASSESAGYTTPEVSPHAFLGTIWAFTVLSFALLPVRLYVRWKTTHRLFWDDVFVISSWVLSLAITITVTVFENVTYDIMLIGSGHRVFPPNVEVITMQFTRVFAIIPMIFYTGIWCVKIAFLLFFHRLGIKSVGSLNRWWWIVTGVTLVCYASCFATLPYRCTLLTFQVTSSRECMTQGLSFVSMWVNSVFDVLTDFLIMSIPFLILRKVRITKRQKIALSGIFSLVVVTISFAIIRATVTTVGVKQQIDPVWMYMWTSIELNIAIVVACVAPYRALFIRDRSPPPRSFQPRLSLKEKVSNLFASTEIFSRRRGERGGHTWATSELPYLAPWPDSKEHAPDTTLCNTGQDVEGFQSPSRCDEPWLTAEMPHLEPWYEEGKSERVCELQDADILSPIPTAHLRSYHTLS